MEPEGSLPCSQGLANGPYSEQDESSPHTPFRLLKIFVLLHVVSWHEMLQTTLKVHSFIHNSFCCLSYDRAIASSQASHPQSVI